MLDINFIRENKKLVAKAIKDKNVDIDIDKILELDDLRRELQKKGDQLRSARNNIADLLKKPEKRTPELVAEGKKLKEESVAIEEQEREVLGKLREMLLLVPNIPSPDTPVGPNEQSNEVIKKVGDIPDFDFEIKDHISLGEDLGLLDLQRGVKVSGFRGYFLKNQGAQMHLAILNYAFNKLVAKGFVPMIVPTIVRRDTLVNMGQFPLHEEETYLLKENKKCLEKNQEEEKYLAGTAEVALLNYYSNEVLKKEQLPIKLVGFSQCYRSEAGSYGKDTKGLYRIHEFAKVEQVVLAENDLEKSEVLHQELLEISEEILQDLKLPYRVVITSTGDQGLGKYKMYDIETWMPSRQGYGETHSNSLLTDWQARRANIRYEDGQDIKFVHTLNNTAIASPRILIAIWENYQQKDGSIKVPEVLLPYMQGISQIKN